VGGTLICDDHRSRCDPNRHNRHEESASASEELSSQATEMEDLVAQLNAIVDGKKSFKKI
jgi:hypothetical protein